MTTEAREAKAAWEATIERMSDAIHDKMEEVRRAWADAYPDSREIARAYAIAAYEAMEAGR